MSPIAIQFLFLLLFLVSYIFFLVTQQNTLKAIQPQNRAMTPGEVWLQLIPFFNLVWQFVAVIRVSNSIKREYQYRQENSFLGLPDPEVTAELNKKPAYDIGIAYCVLACCSIIPVPQIKLTTSLGALICWIIYWAKLAEYKNKLRRLAATNRGAFQIFAKQHS